MVEYGSESMWNRPNNDVRLETIKESPVLQRERFTQNTFEKGGNAVPTMEGTFLGTVSVQPAHRIRRVDVRQAEVAAHEERRPRGPQVRDGADSPRLEREGLCMRMHEATRSTGEGRCIITVVSNTPYRTSEVGKSARLVG